MTDTARSRRTSRAVSSVHVIALPSYDQVLDLPAVIKLEVPPEYLDENEHMNIGRYLEVSSRAFWERTTELGMGQRYIDERRLTTFTVEQHLRYFSELRLDEAISVHVRMMERSDKAVHSMAFVLDSTNQRLAFTMEVTIVHVGMDTRRPEDFPDDVAKSLDAEIADHALDWAVPVCGSMGIRRR